MSSGALKPSETKRSREKKSIWVYVVPSKAHFKGLNGPQSSQQGRLRSKPAASHAHRATFGLGSTTMGAQFHNSQVQNYQNSFFFAKEATNRCFPSNLSPLLEKRRSFGGFGAANCETGLPMWWSQGQKWPDGHGWRQVWASTGLVLKIGVH